MKTSGLFFCAVLLVDTLFISYWVGFNSRHVLIVDPTLPPLKPAVVDTVKVDMPKNGVSPKPSAGKVGVVKSQNAKSDPKSHSTTAKGHEATSKLHGAKSEGATHGGKSEGSGPGTKGETKPRVGKPETKSHEKPETKSHAAKPTTKPATSPAAKP